MIFQSLIKPIKLLRFHLINGNGQAQEQPGPG